MDVVWFLVLVISVVLILFSTIGLFFRKRRKLAKYLLAISFIGAVGAVLGMGLSADTGQTATSAPGGSVATTQANEQTPKHDVKGFELGATLEEIAMVEKQTQCAPSGREQVTGNETCKLPDGSVIVLQFAPLLGRLERIKLYFVTRMNCSELKQYLERTFKGYQLEENGQSGDTSRSCDDPPLYLAWKAGPYELYVMPSGGGFSNEPTVFLNLTGFNVMSEEAKAEEDKRRQGVKDPHL